MVTNMVVSSSLIDSIVDDVKEVVGVLCEEKVDELEVKEVEGVKDVEKAEGIEDVEKAEDGEKVDRAETEEIDTVEDVGEEDE